MTPPSASSSTWWSIKLPFELRVVEVLKTEKEKEKMEPTMKREEQVKKDTGLHNKIN
jgi:hypothetical protein